METALEVRQMDYPLYALTIYLIQKRIRAGERKRRPVRVSAGWWGGLMRVAAGGEGDENVCGRVRWHERAVYPCRLIILAIDSMLIHCAANTHILFLPPFSSITIIE
jgi:hypothetical protein